MPSRRLTPRTALDVRLSAFISQHLLTRHADPLVDELRRLADDDLGLFAQVAGSCAGWYWSAETAPLRDALVDQIEGAAPWAKEARERRLRGTHGAPRRAVDRPRQTDRAGEGESEV